jgi:hypothetical protein
MILEITLNMFADTIILVLMGVSIIVAFAFLTYAFLFTRILSKLEFKSEKAENIFSTIIFVGICVMTFLSQGTKDGLLWGVVLILALAAQRLLSWICKKRNAPKETQVLLTLPLFWVLIAVGCFTEDEYFAIDMAGGLILTVFFVLSYMNIKKEGALIQLSRKIKLLITTVITFLCIGIIEIAYYFFR